MKAVSRFVAPLMMAGAAVLAIAVAPVAAAESFATAAGPSIGVFAQSPGGGGCVNGSGCGGGDASGGGGCIPNVGCGSGGFGRGGGCVTGVGCGSGDFTGGGGCVVGVGCGGYRP